MVIANDWHGVHVLSVNPVQQVVQARSTGVRILGESTIFCWFGRGECAWWLI
jgi:hypothetical protein